MGETKEKRGYKKILLKPKELIILGMAHSRWDCPFDAEVWSVNTGYTQIAEAGGHVNKIFLAHKQVKYKNGENVFNWEHYNKLTELGVEIFNTHRIKGLKSKRYPLKRIAKKFGCDYFSNTICYMIAYAIDKGYGRIRFYGCDMRETGEYALEKGGVEYWIGFARGLGIDIWIQEASSLLHTVTYAPYGIKEFDFYTVMFGIGRTLGITAGAVWSRGLGFPIERPKSVTTEWIEKNIQ